MTIQVKHKKVSAKVDTLDSSRIQPSNWNDTHDLLLAGGVVVGRAAGVGQAAATEIPMGVTGQALLATGSAAAAQAVIGADGTQEAIAAATVKAAPVDGDNVAILDSAAGYVLKRITWAAIKATLKTYFDTLYIAAGGAITSTQNFISSTANLVLGTTGAGSIYLRPNGVGSVAGEARVDSAGNVTIAGIVNPQGAYYRAGVLLPIQRKFESAQQVITNGATITIPHGLGVQPDLYFARLQCVSGDLGYSAGQEISLDNGGTGNKGISLVPDATNLVIRIGTASPDIIRKDNGVGDTITNSRWRLVLVAFAQ